MNRCSTLVRTTAVVAALAAALTASPLTAQRPDSPFTTQERFDPSAVPAYTGSHPDIYEFIDAHRDEHLENLRRWVRQPSISAENKGIQQMAEMLRDDLKKLGFQEAELVPTSGHPGVWGFYDAGAPVTLAIYMMYDVQPVEPQGWKVDPFAGELVDHDLGKVLMARGATNQKGPQRAFLNSLEAILAVRGKLPVNLMVAAEGEEELGSPNFPEVIERYADRLKTADGVFFPANLQDPGGSVSMILGVKGILYFEMEAKGGPQGGPQTAEIHGSMKAIVDSPVLRLAQAIASLTSPDGNTILVPGYYDAIRPPNEEEQRLVNGMLDQWSQQEPMMRKSLGVERWIGGKTGRDSLLDSLFETTLNVDGIWGGYTGPGVKTILPHKATAKLDSRLVPDQKPDEQLRLIRAHLDAKGFKDIEIRKLSGYPPAQSTVEAPLIQSAIGVIRKYGIVPSVSPRIAGSAPYYLFTDRLKLPMLFGGLGHGSGAHAPNEYMLIDPKPGSKIAGLAELEKFYVDLLFRLAEPREREQ